MPQLDQQRRVRRFSKSRGEVDAIDEQIEEAMKRGEGFGERGCSVGPHDDIYRSHSVERIVGTWSLETTLFRCFRRGVDSAR